MIYFLQKELLLKILQYFLFAFLVFFYCCSQDFRYEEESITDKGNTKIFTQRSYPALIFSEFHPAEKWVEVSCNSESFCDLKNIKLSDLNGREIPLGSNDNLVIDKNFKKIFRYPRVTVIRWLEVRKASENNISGDLNNNGIRDVYILEKEFPWKHDGIIALVQDEQAGKNILDLIFFSNGDQQLANDTRAGLESAYRLSHWIVAVYPGSEQDSIAVAKQEKTTTLENFSFYQDTDISSNLIIKSFHRKIENQQFVDLNTKDDWKLNLPSPGKNELPRFTEESNLSNEPDCFYIGDEPILPQKIICRINSSVIEISGKLTNLSDFCDSDITEINAPLKLESSCSLTENRWNISIHLTGSLKTGSFKISLFLDNNAFYGILVLVK